MKLPFSARFLLRSHIVRLLVTFFVNLTGNLFGLLKQLPIQVRGLRKGWGRLSHFRRHFFLNLLIGFSIAIGLHFAHHTSWVQETENMAMDAMMSVNQRLPRMTGVHQGTPLAFTFIDIDEDTYRAWDEPFPISRNKLLRLIRFATEGGAKAVVLNVDLSKPSDMDAKLLAYLESYRGSKRPPLLLVRSFYPPSEYTKGNGHEVRPSILDSIPNGDRVVQGQPMFRRSHYDGSVRHWYLLKTGCLQGKPLVLPSLQLALDALLAATRGDRPLDRIQKLAPNECNEIDHAKHEKHSVLRYGQRRIDLSQYPVGERLIYTLPWRGGSATDLDTISARRISESKHPLATDLVKDRIVVIGASFVDSRDIYPTPLGEMPGALIVLNAIKSLHLFGQIKPPSAVVKWGIEVALIVLMAWAFARFDSLKGTLLTGLVIVVTLLPVSFYFFKYGLWVDFALPLLGMQFHQLVAEYEESVAMKRHLRTLQRETENENS